MVRYCQPKLVIKLCDVAAFLIVASSALHRVLVRVLVAPEQKLENMPSKMPQLGEIFRVWSTV